MIFKCVIVLLLLVFTWSQRNADLPREVHGYKVQRARVELKQTRNPDQEIGAVLIRLGEPKLVGVSPLGVTFDLPVILAPVKQEGEIDRLVFESMRVNETPVTIQDYRHRFKLPNKEPLTLKPALRIFVSTPQAILTTIDEFLNSKPLWPVTGRIYVCGHYKKFLFKLKRAVPVELQTSIPNPLRAGTAYWDRGRLARHRARSARCLTPLTGGAITVSHGQEKQSAAR